MKNQFTNLLTASAITLLAIAGFFDSKRISLLEKRISKLECKATNSLSESALINQIDNLYKINAGIIQGMTLQDNITSNLVNQCNAFKIFKTQELEWWKDYADFHDDFVVRIVSNEQDIGNIADILKGVFTSAITNQPSEK